MNNTASHEELAGRAAELGFKTSADDYRLIDNRLKALRSMLEVVRGIDVTGFEPASTFSPLSGGPSPTADRPSSAAARKSSPTGHSSSPRRPGS